MAQKYNVGDKVRIKNIDWYNENKNKFGKVWTSGGQIPFDKCMSEWCGKVMTISHVRADHYTMVEDLVGYWTDEMIEGLVEEETKPNIIEEAKTYWDSIKDAWICPNGYIFKDEHGNVIPATKIVLEKKKKQYPKTYEECLKVLGYDDRETYCICHTLANERLFEALYRLKVCRDAYWKIAGEEMGLGRPWEPDWKNSEESRYCIVNIEGDINLPEKILTKWILKVTNKILVFPTEEMRDAFYENFKEEIEKCKELL